MQRLIWIAVCLSISLWADLSLAHASRQSFVMLDLRDRGVLAELRLPMTELGLALKHPMKNDSDHVVDRYGAEIGSYVTANVRLIGPDGRRWTVEPKGMTGEADDGGGDVVVDLWLVPPPGASPRTFTLDYDVITHEVVSHVALVSVRSDWDAGVFSDKPAVVGTIRHFRKSLIIDRSETNAWRGFRGVFQLGLQHIAEGTDHLLFLLALLLPAPLLAQKARWGGFGGVKYSAQRLLWTVTAFSLGHSLTLLAGAVGWLRLPSRPVEIVIAVSILVSAVHAMRPLFPGRERWIAAGFGLVHGFAFAGAIADLGLSPLRLGLAILGFNLGIEAMQLVVVVLSAPWLVLLARTKLYSFVRIGGAAFAAAAAIGWIGQRAFGWRNPLDAAMTSMASHGGFILLGLATFAVGFTIVSRRLASNRSVPLVA